MTGEAMNLQALPKVELHLHLDCSPSFDVVSRLSPSTTREQFEREFIAPSRCTNLADFLKRPPKCIALMQDEEPLRMVVDDVFAQLQRDNLIYAEIRFAPLLHLEHGLEPEDVVEIVDQAVAKASESSGIEAGIILFTLRHYTQEQSLTTVKLVEKFRGRRVVALDIAGDEAGYPLDVHIPAFAYAAEKKLARTAHCGEAKGPESVWETLKLLSPSRIGHGVRSTEDPKLMQHLRDHGIHMEVCPSSNVQTNMYESYGEHPVGTLATSGVSFGVSTDCRTVCNITLNQEYELLRKNFSWDMNQFLRCNLNAVQASFAPEPVKQSLIARLHAGYGVAREQLEEAISTIE